MADQILPFVYMLGILLLVLPAFLQSNSKLKQFLTNLTIWIVIILIILTIIYFINYNPTKPLIKCLGDGMIVI